MKFQERQTSTATRRELNVCQQSDMFQTARRGFIAAAACLVIASCGGGGGAGATGEDSPSSDLVASPSKDSDSSPPDVVDRYVATWASECAGDASQNPVTYERLSFRFTKVSATSIASEGRHETFAADSTCGQNGTLISSSHSIAEFTGHKTLADGKVVDMFKVTETTADAGIGAGAGDVRLSIMFIQDGLIYSGDETGIDSATAYPDALETRLALKRL